MIPTKARNKDDRGYYINIIGIHLEMICGTRKMKVMSAFESKIPQQATLAHLIAPRIVGWRFPSGSCRVLAWFLQDSCKVLAGFWLVSCGVLVRFLLYSCKVLAIFLQGSRRVLAGSMQGSCMILVSFRSGSCPVLVVVL